MRTSASTVLLAIAVGVSAPARADTLSLSRAIEMAVASSPQVQAATESAAAARDQRAAASAGWLPRLDLQEAWQRGNQPVFVFSSLLSQRRFAAANFALDALNHPEAVDNHRAAVMLQEPLFDVGGTLAPARAARTNAAIAEEARREAALNVAVAVTQAYTDVLRAQAAGRAARAAIASATEDGERARARRDAGTATDADVLAIDVHLAQMRAADISATGDGVVAAAQLNRLIGAPLETKWDLIEPTLSTPDATAPSEAVDQRPDVVRSALQVELAEHAREAAGGALLPRVTFDGGLEWNGGAWDTRSSAWIVGVQGELTLSLGGVERARRRAATHDVARARVARADTDTAARVDLLTARTRLEGAIARAAVGAAALTEARESDRITRDRYGAGLAGVSDVLRAARALVDADTLATSARLDVAVAAAMLDRARGRLPAPVDGRTP